jgi:hypothetical protein
MRAYAEGFGDEGHCINPAQLCVSDAACVGECVGGAESEPRTTYEIVKAGRPWTRGAGAGSNRVGRLSNYRSALHIRLNKDGLSRRGVQPGPVPPMGGL